MNCNWEKDGEKLLRYMKISPIKKLRWLRQMHEFTIKLSSKKANQIRIKLRNPECSK